MDCSAEAGWTDCLWREESLFVQLDFITVEVRSDCMWTLAQLFVGRVKVKVGKRPSSAHSCAIWGLPPMPRSRAEAAAIRAKRGRIVHSLCKRSFIVLSVDVVAALGLQCAGTAVAMNRS